MKKYNNVVVVPFQPKNLLSFCHFFYAMSDFYMHHIAVPVLLGTNIKKLLNNKLKTMRSTFKLHSLSESGLELGWICS